ncbi:MAG TPA: hypothetical protein VHX61_18650, partial [Rhizomicrobium sp.]|nr:hypothetical protein [Rhizomicrobium sp.]
MSRFSAWLLACALACWSVPAHAQAGATPPPDKTPAAAAQTDSQPGQPATADDICRALEQDAAENALPVEFFAR